MFGRIATFACDVLFIVVRFHVEHHSSAHIYLRLPRGMTIDTIPPQLVEECAQITKDNSIEGSFDSFPARHYSCELQDASYRPSL